MNKYANGMMVAAAALVASCALIGCEKKPDVVAGGPPPPPPASGLVISKPAEPNGFEATVSKLDVGGPFLLYVSTEQLLSNISVELEGWKPAVLSLKKDDPDAAKKTNLIFSQTSNLIKKSGIEQLNGFGVSVFPVEAGLTRGKMFVQHPKEDLSKTLIWNICGSKAHPLNEIKLLPQNTAVAFFTDFDLGFLWNFIKTELQAFPDPEVSQVVTELPAEYEKSTQLKWDDTLASLGNQIGFVMTLDPAKKMTIPNMNYEINEPGVAIVIKTKSDLIFKKIDAQLGTAIPNLAKTDEGDVKMRSMQLPAGQLGVDMELSPTLAQTKDYLIFASSTALVKAMLDSLSDKTPGIAATSEEFKKLRANTPVDGNAFSYVSKEFGALMATMQKASATQSELPPEAMDKFTSSYTTPASFSVWAHLDDGWYGVSNTASSYAGLVQPARALPGLAIMGILAEEDPPTIDLDNSSDAAPPAEMNTPAEE